MFPLSGQPGLTLSPSRQSLHTLSLSRHPQVVLPVALKLNRQPQLVLPVALKLIHVFSQRRAPAWLRSLLTDSSSLLCPPSGPKAYSRFLSAASPSTSTLSPNRQPQLTDVLPADSTSLLTLSLSADSPSYCNSYLLSEQPKSYFNYLLAHTTAYLQ